MPVPTAISDLSQTAASNSPPGSESPTTADNYLRTYAAFIAELRDGSGYSAEATVASAATADIGGAASLFVQITGTTTITSFGTDYSGPRFIRFADALTLTHNASSLILPGGVNITTAAGDTCIATPISGGWVVSFYERASGNGRLIGTQTFTSSGTYTPTAGTTSVIVEVQAPGGGSGGCVATTAGQWAAGRPGAGGGYGRKRITSGFSGTTVTIGAAGTAGSAGDNAGGTGGTTSFGAHVSCTGGAGGGGSGAVQTAIGFSGNASNNPALGGEPTGADVGQRGASPETAIGLSSTMVNRPNGGDAVLGAGAYGGSLISNNAGGATPAHGYGGGAAGPANANGSFSAQAGAAGAAGIIVVWEYA